MGIGAAVFQILRTPREEWFVLQRQKSLAEQMATYPISVEAVIIKGNKKRFIIKWLPMIVIAVLLILFTLFLELSEDPECNRLFGLNTSFLALVEFTYVLPITVFIVTLYFIEVGFKTIRSGYFPPLNSVRFSDAIAKKNLTSKIRGLVLLLSPLLGAYLIYQGHHSFMQISDGLKYEEITEKLESECS